MRESKMARTKRLRICILTTAALKEAVGGLEYFTMQLADILRTHKNLVHGGLKRPISYMLDCRGLQISNHSTTRYHGSGTDGNAAFSRCTQAKDSGSVNSQIVSR